jgi:hypothetical protein
MKRRMYGGLLAVEAAACIASMLVQASFAGVFSAMAAFPFEQIGLGLRALSLSGGPGNVAAIVLYAAVSLAPVGVLFLLRKQRKLLPEEGLLGIFSIALFAVLYLMINPGVMGIPADVLATGKMVLGGALYSILCGYFVLRALRLFLQSDVERLTKYMSVMLGLLGVLLVYVVCGTCFGGLLNSFTSLRAGNVGNEHDLGTSYVFLWLQFAVDVLPYVLDVWVIFAALRLLDAVRADRYSEGAVAATTRLSRYCAVALVVTVLTNMGFNLLQLLFAKMLRSVNVSVSIPIFSIVFVLAALLLTRFVAENKQLKDENDAFI